MFKNYNERINQKVARFQELREKESLSDAEQEERKKLTDEILALKAERSQWQAEEDLIKSLDVSLKTPPSGGDPQKRSFQVVDPPVYRTLGAQLQDIVRAGVGAAGAPEARERLDRNDKRNLDMMKADPEQRSVAQTIKTSEDGGGLVQTDYAFDLVDKGFNNGVIVSKCSVRNSTSNANALTLYGLDENSRVDGARYGGIQVYTKREEAQYDPSKAKFAEISLKVNKITGMLKLTDEVMEDAGVLEGEVRGLFPLAFAFKLQDLVIRGRGNGEPLGIMESKALLSITKETDQVAKTINADNISKMKAAAMGNGEFFGHRDIIPQLDNLYRVYEGNKVNPLFKQTSMTTGVLDGVPITFVEQAETIGTLGDLILADWSQYVILRKGGIKEMESLHFYFDTGHKAIKWTMRIDGMSRVKSALTPYKGTNKTSPFVGLATRA